MRVVVFVGRVVRLQWKLLTESPLFFSFLLLPFTYHCPTLVENNYTALTSTNNKKNFNNETVAGFLGKNT